jgi:hypothetical protein
MDAWLMDTYRDLRKINFANKKNPVMPASEALRLARSYEPPYFRIAREMRNTISWDTLKTRDLASGKAKILNWNHSLSGPGWNEHAKDMPAIRPLLARRRPARGDFKSGAAIRGLAYVARFIDGREMRVSFYSRGGKPIDFAQGFNVAMLLGRAVPIGGHVELNGERIEDPHFSAASVPNKINRVKRSSAADVLLARLLEWESQQGGYDAPAWREARAYMAKIRREKIQVAA